MPDNAYCNPVDDWDASWVAWELEVIELVNAARASGGSCGSEGTFAASGPLTWEATLTCAARVHSMDMGENDYFSHTNLMGNGPGWRLDQAGYSGGGWGENIAAGYGSPEDVVQGWLDSDGHCANMLNGSFTLIGVGYANVAGSDYGHYWTQTFGN
ncbi:CAP domain-containing protein [Pseudenhygromyxa sp. WMMC2535]|nr:CAP domain-containing protein [Pseudenhygromyxa sp. WMMC2535]